MTIKLWDFQGFECVKTMHGKMSKYFFCLHYEIDASYDIAVLVVYYGISNTIVLEIP